MMNSLSDVFEYSTDAVFGIDATGRIRFANSMFGRLMGSSPNMLCGKQCAMILCGTDVHGKPFCGPHCPIPKEIIGQPSISDFDLVVKHTNGYDILVNIGANYVPPRLHEAARQVVIFFSMRQVEPQRLLQRVDKAPEERPVRTVRHRLNQLSSREKEILELAVNGRKTSQIAGDLSISTQTVRTHFRNLYQKLGVSSRTEAVIIALQHEMIRPGIK